MNVVVLGKSPKGIDLTEKMAFFEAYGAIAGAAGLKALTARRFATLEQDASVGAKAKLLSFVPDELLREAVAMID